MGQHPSSSGLRLQGEPRRKLRLSSHKTSASEMIEFSAIIDLGSERVSVNYSPGLTTTAELISAIACKRPSAQKCAALCTAERIDILDYMLSIHRMPVSHLKDEEVLLPYYSDSSAVSGPELFQPIKTIGKGGFSLVTLARKKDTGVLYAVKTISKDYVIQHRRIEHSLNERKLLSTLSHPFIIQLNSSFQTLSDLHLVLEYCPGGELFYHLHNLGRFSEDQARFYFAEIMLAVEYLHLNSIVYRDLKPENILLDYAGHIKLTDFGTSRAHSKEELRYTYCGSAEYMSPEMISKSGHGLSIDCFSLGSLLYEMLTGMPPFYDPDTEKMFWKIQNEPLVLPKYFSAEVKHLLSGLMDKDPNNRIGCEFITDIKDHPWCSGVHWQKVFKKKMRPPFRPNYRVSNFDQEFTSIPVNEEMFSQKAYVPDPFDKFYEFNVEEVVMTEGFSDVDEGTSNVHSVVSNECLRLDAHDDIGLTLTKSTSFEECTKESPQKIVVLQRPVEERKETGLTDNQPEPPEVIGLKSLDAGMSKMKVQLMKKFNNT